MAQKGDKEHGEGNYKASRDYNEATKRFVESGRVDEAARKAKPRNPSEAAELEGAEAQGLARAKEEDPEVLFGSDAVEGAGEDGSQPRDDNEDDPEGTRITDRAADQTSTPRPGREGS